MAVKSEMTCNGYSNQHDLIRIDHYLKVWTVTIIDQYLKVSLGTTQKQGNDATVSVKFCIYRILFMNAIYVKYFLKLNFENNLNSLIC